LPNAVVEPIHPKAMPVIPTTHTVILLLHNADLGTIERNAFR